MNFKINWDAFGIGTSVACAIHCAVLPLVATSLPIFGVNIIENGLFEWSMIALAFVIGIYALVHGFITHHQSWKPIIIFSAGFALLVLKQFFHSYLIWFLIPGVILIIVAHYINYRKCHIDTKHQHCEHHQH